MSKSEHKPHVFRKHVEGGGVKRNEETELVGWPLKWKSLDVLVSVARVRRGRLQSVSRSRWVCGSVS